MSLNFWPGASTQSLAQVRARAANRRRHHCRHGDPQPGPCQASSLSLAMGLTTILTTIWVFHRNTPKCKILNFKENWTSEDVYGHAADVWGSRGREFKSRQPD